MRSAARTAAVSAPALVVVAAAWLRLEQPLPSLWRVLALLALALAAALPRRRWLRVAGAVAATVAAAQVAVGVDLVPWRLDAPGSGFGLTDSFATLGTRFGNGFDDFYSTHLPFDPRVHAAMSELVLAGSFVFALAVVLLAAARRPVGSALALLLGAGWPATLLGPSHGVAMGAAILAAALVLLAGLGSRRVPALALPAAAAVATAAVVVGPATAARHGLVHWQTWNLAHVATGPSAVSFVWNAQYGGLKWSGRPTNVLQVQSDRPPAYLRAAVLDDFVGDAWAVGLQRAADSLEPAAALSPRHETRESVTVLDLADTHLVGGSVPVRFQAAGGAPLLERPGFASLDQNLPKGFRYTVWSYTARPSAARLRRSKPEYPPVLVEEGMLDVGGSLTLPPFGTPDRAAHMLSLVETRPVLAPYMPLVRLAERIAGRARTPYDAVADLENWFVSSGKFRYTNHPPVLSPPLVGFVTRTHAGYCQYFAGAMALMLRYLGIPSRVAVGFAGGTYDPNQHLWNISDREAHAWVEVWFKGYGWLPFDPTPAGPGAPLRPTQDAEATRGGRAVGPTPNTAGRGATSAHSGRTAAQILRTKRHHSFAVQAVSGGGGGDRSLPVLLLLAALGAAGGGIVLTKAGFRLARRIRRHPRGIAAACRQELVAFLVDQGIEAPRSATFGELGDLFRRQFGVSSEELVAAATAARFGPSEAGTAAARTARRELRLVLAAARRRLTRRERVRGLLSLRSLMRPRAVDALAPAGSGTAGSPS
jgi:transglutaminase-like putative cysteine protease